MRPISGRDPDPKQLKLMMEESPNQLNFTHFLTLFGEKLHGKGWPSALARCRRCCPLSADEGMTLASPHAHCPAALTFSSEMKPGRFILRLPDVAN